MARANSMPRPCAGAAIVVPGAEPHERNVIPTPCGLVNYFHKVVDPQKVDHRPGAGEEISAGNEKRVVAGGGDPFSLRESKDPRQTTTRNWVLLAAALSRQCSATDAQLVALQNNTREPRF